MKKQTAQKRIQNAVNKKLKNESQKVKDYFCEVIYLSFLNLEYDFDEEYTSIENLKYALDINLIDNFSDLLKEARQETM